MKCLLSFLIMISLTCISAEKMEAQDSLHFPTPSGVPNQLFFLQRTQNTNTIIYQLNIKAGILDSANPIHIFWICYAEKSQEEELTYVQRKFAYGIETTSVGKGDYEIRFLANKKYVMNLMKGSDGQYHVFAKLNGKQAILNKIFLQIHGGSVFSPNIEYVLLNGTDPDTGAPVFEKLVPTK